MRREPLESYGIDSVMIMQLNHGLAADLWRAVEDAVLRVPDACGGDGVSGGGAWRGLRALDGAG